MVCNLIFFLYDVALHTAFLTIQDFSYIFVLFLLNKRTIGRKIAR